MTQRSWAAKSRSGAGWRARGNPAFASRSSCWRRSFSSLLIGPWLPDWLRIVPKEWSAPFVGWINAAVEFLRTEEFFGLLTFRDMTRAIANLIDYPLNFVEAILVGGFADSVPFRACPGLP